MKELKEALKRIDRAIKLVNDGLAKRGYAMPARGIGPSDRVAPVEWMMAITSLGQTRTTIVQLRDADRRDANRRQREAKK